MTIQTPEERDKLRELEAENARLKALVADLSLEKAILESTVVVIEGTMALTLKNELPSLSGQQK